MSIFDAFESQDTVDDVTYDRRVAKLRADLLDVQYDVLARKTFPVIVLINGVEGAGKGETVNLLHEWMDPRHIHTYAFGEPSKEERARPEMWRFWRAQPPKGRIGVLFGNWYTHPIVARVEKTMTNVALERHVERIAALEDLLDKDGGLLLKFWFHLSKKAQKKRLQTLEKDKLTSWRVTPDDWKRFKDYDNYVNVSEHVLRATSVIPWHIVNGFDANRRSLEVGELLLSAMRRRLSEDDTARATKVVSAPASEKKVSAHKKPHAPAATSEYLSLLRNLKFEERLSKEQYEIKIEKAQRDLNELSRNPTFTKKRGCVVVFEGNDAAGKGGAIRRVTAALDARQYRVVPIAAPSADERAFPYLWRFWNHLPARGKFVLFDRSWYGRVLVERVEGYATTEEWHRAYHEIEAFERDMVDHDIVVVKFWLAVTKEEQLRRFNEREKTRFKRFKITDDDWRNRKKWESYEAAACDMIARTSGISAWNIIEANDKHLARVRIVKTIADAVEASL